MNAILEYPLEALAFHYLSFGFFTAVVSAAVGFWMIKTSSTLPEPELRGDISSHAPPTSMLVSNAIFIFIVIAGRKATVNPAGFSMSKEISSPATTMMSSEAAFLVKEEGTKRKLTVHFKQDEGGECNRDEDSDQQGEDDGIELSKEWFENWEILLKMRKGEMGCIWYRCQDMKVIDGSVVRFWDGSRRRREAEKTAFTTIVSAW